MGKKEGGKAGEVGIASLKRKADKFDKEGKSDEAFDTWVEIGYMESTLPE